MSAPADRYTPGHRPPPAIGLEAIWCVFRDRQLLVRRAGGTVLLPRLRAEDLAARPDETHYLGTLDGEHCYALALAPGQPLPAETEFMGMRAFILEADDIVAAVAGRACQMIEWACTHRYCGSYGGPTIPHAVDRARECPGCGRIHYPRINPVIMALVTRGRQLLLTRKPGYVTGRYTVIAGFVEAGESLEHALTREVREETGVEVVAPRYFGSQPWPFPNSLVMAFRLEYAGGEARPDGMELEEARWFDIGALPDLPEAVHISRQLIDATIAQISGSASQTP